MHKKEYDDLEDIRSNVLGDFRGLPPPSEPDFPRPRQIEVPAFEEPFRREERFGEPPGFSSIDMRERFPEREQSRNYDILDRLNLIESQLAAIRSQTETINERLKNLEAKLTRRY